MIISPFFATERCEGSYCPCLQYSSAASFKKADPMHKLFEFNKVREVWKGSRLGLIRAPLTFRGYSLD